MMTLVEFTKMHGAGNDFVVVDEWDCLVVPEKSKKGFVARVCDRHFGVGGDGVIFVQRSDSVDAHFVFYNPDGSLAEMCGNGIRCFARYLYERGLVKKKSMAIDSLAGVKTIALEVKGDAVKSVTVDMGVPVVGFIDKVVSVGKENYRMTSVNMGNPHVVIFVKDVSKVDVRGIGKEVRHYKKLFPRGTNVHFVEKIRGNEFRIRTFERGVEDETLACGTGICASGTAAIANKLADEKKTILFHALGGDVSVALKTDPGGDKRIFMSGPAEEVYSGTINV